MSTTRTRRAPRLRRLAAAATGGALVTAGLLAVAPAPAAQAEPVNPEADAAATWLADRLDGGLLSANVSTTMDFGLSMLQTGTDTPERLSDILAGVDAGLEDYLDTAYSRPASTAKAAYFYAAAGADPTDAAGLDLVADTETNVDDATGQIGDGTVFSQVWAAFALDAVNSDEAPTARAALIDGQCEDSGAWGFACDGGLDLDYTAYSVVALLPHVDSDPESAAAVENAVNWLIDEQGPNGEFGESQYTPDNTNSTGLVAWALGEAGEAEAAADAAAWVADHQIALPARCPTSPLSLDQGGIAYDDQAVRDGLARGIDAADESLWTLAGAQALAGLSHLGERPASAATLTAPTGYVRAGTTISVEVAGLRPGLQACLTGAGRPQWVVGSETVRTTLPRGTARHVVRLNHTDGAATRTVQALGRARFKVRVPARIKAKRKARVVVAGLAPREVTTVRVGKRKVTRRASATGRLVVRFRAPRAKGRLRVAVVGEFRDRTGGARFRVV